MRIGIYGGTFNPIHKTHIEIAQAAKSQFNLDIVYFVIAGKPPHKNTNEDIADTCRLAMLEIALADHEGFKIDDRELYRSGKSYSYITFSELKKERSEDEIFFIMGSDSLLNFKNWVNPEIISSCCTVIAAPRLGDSIDELTACIDEYHNIFAGKFSLIDYQANSISSSEIRDLFYNNENVRNCLSQKVCDYIIKHHLYSNLYSIDFIREIDAKMQKELKKGRYIHTVGVANMAYSLAIKWDYPAYNAFLAGLLHDSAKCISDEERLKICEKNNIEISDIEYKYPHLLHGKVGAFFCESKYDVFDEDIRHAITVHTTGCPNMSLLDKIIFVADYLEPGRDKQPRLDILRSVAYNNIDLCVYMILEDTVEYLNSNPDMTDPTTIDTFNFYKERIRGNS